MVTKQPQLSSLSLRTSSSNCCCGTSVLGPAAPTPAAAAAGNTPPRGGAWTGAADASARVAAKASYAEAWQRMLGAEKRAMQSILKLELAPLVAL